MRDIDITNLILIIGIVGVIISRVGEGRGWFRSAAGLRVENTDLVRRNTELEAIVARHEIELAANAAKIGLLQLSIRDLRERDQAAVLDLLKVVEEKADKRHLEKIGVLARIEENTLQSIHTTTKGL